MQKALYRAYRPQTFDEVVGQDAIVTALKNQIMTGHIGHAYLFSGTRGTGKTSCAKIFARAVNCLEPQEGNPCNACAHCRAILDETTMDVVEMDAASNRGIDDIRELRETVIYPPAQVRYKVYIIDEAHMITKEGFNALLKMMEEPPAHLIFILATTEPEKIPPTILSRVQRYEFKRIDVEVIMQRLSYIAEKQGVTITPEALTTLARAADGALRDALSLLDQVMAMGETDITEELVDRVLGTAGKLSLTELTRDVLNDRMTAAMTHAASLLQEGKEAAVLLREWIAYFQQLLLIKGAGKEWKVPISELERREMEGLVADVPMTRLLDSVDHLVEIEVLLQKSDHAETLFLAAVARLINYASPRVLESRIAALEQKLAIVERWQSPEKAIRDALDRLQAVASTAPQATIPLAKDQPTSAVAPVAPQPIDAAQSSASPKLATPSIAPKSPEQPKTAQPIAPKSPEPPKASPQPETTSLQSATASPQPTTAPQPTTPSNSFSADPEGWYRRHEDAWRNVVEKEKIVPTFFLGRFAKIDVHQGDAYVSYARENEAKGALLKGKEEELSAAFSRFAGETIRLHLGEESPARRPSSSTTGSTQSKDLTSLSTQPKNGTQPEGRKQPKDGTQPEDRKKSKDGMSTSTKTTTVPTTAVPTTPPAASAIDKGRMPLNLSGDADPASEAEDWTWQELQRTIPKEILKKME